ncbi:hypothetical protein ACLB2K_068141 [Fragaria x ananassa]
MDLQNDFDRMLFFQHACMTSEAAHAVNPSDVDNLTRWAGALLELSQFQGAQESKIMVRDAISKLEEVLVINPKKHDALWCLGNAHTTNAFLTPDSEEANGYFDIAVECFKKAVAEIILLLDFGHANIFRAVKQCLPGPCIRFGTTTAKYKSRKDVGVRMPDDAICQTILEKMDSPLISTRALILSLRVADPSTVVDMTVFPPKILRQGKGPQLHWMVAEDDNEPAESVKSSSPLPLGR